MNKLTSKSKNLNILHIYKSYYPDTQGGVERLIHMLAVETSLEGCSNRLLTCTKEKKFYIKKDKELEVYYYPQTIALASCPFSYTLWKDFSEQVQWADIVHYHFPWPMADGLHYGKKIQKPTVVTYHSDVVRQKVLRFFYYPLMKIFLKQITKIVATSQNYVDTSEVLKHYREKTQVIPIGIEPSHYHVNAEKKAFWQNKLSSCFFLFVGVLRYYKGVEYLLQALENTDIPFVIVGGGPLLTTLREQAKNLNLKPNQVIFTEEVSDEDLSAIYSLAKALVIPASHRSEAYCIALVEGLLFGLPLISAEIGTGTSFVNQQDKTGLIVPACDVTALRKAMLLLWQNDDLQHQMSVASRARFESLFTAKKMAEKYLEVYKEIS